MNANNNADPYGGGSAEKYDQYHRNRLRTRLTTRREIGVLRQALKVAAPCPTALDLPCGTGRFWPAFADAGVRELIAADISLGMLEVARTNRLSAAIPSRLECMSAFNIELPDDAVTLIGCMRFLHHLSMPEDRQQVLSELHRVSSRFVAISLWVDGNLGAWRRMRKPRPPPVEGFGRRICRPAAEVEQEFQHAGFTIVRYFDVWPKLTMWRLYLLELGDG